MPNVERVPLPPASLGAQVFSKIDYADSYRIQLPPDSPTDLDDLYLKVFTLPSTSLIAKLMRLRNALVKPLGLKTDMLEPRIKREPLQIGDRAGLFKLFQRTDDELLLGEDDKHLDFRVSVLQEQHSGHRWLTISTIVRYNNWLGRLYFLPVRPIHARIVPWMMKHAFRESKDQPIISPRAV